MSAKKAPETTPSPHPPFSHTLLSYLAITWNPIASTVPFPHTSTLGLAKPPLQMSLEVYTGMVESGVGFVLT
jgi:hypothetical protein